MATEELVNAAPPKRRPPLITFFGVVGFLYAYPLYWMLRGLPGPTLWALGIALPPVYRLTHRSLLRSAARQMSQWLNLPESQADVVAERWMDSTIQVIYNRLRLLSGKPTPSPGASAVSGREHLDQALHEGRGVVLVSLHTFGIPEANSLLRELGYPILSVRWFRVPVDYGRIGKRWLEARFERFGELFFPGAEAVSAQESDNTLLLAQRLRKGGIVHLAADVWSKTTVRVPFLNGRSLISPGVIHLARLCRCPVLPLIATGTGAALKVEIGAPLPFQLTGPAEECTRTNLALLIAEMERQVLEHPDQWEKWASRIR